jgi:hypothetical protein
VARDILHDAGKERTLTIRAFGGEIRIMAKGGGIPGAFLAAFLNVLNLQAHRYRYGQGNS